MATEIFSQPILGFLACVAWHRVLLPDIGSSSSFPLYSGQHNLLQVLDVGLHVESEAMWEDEWRRNITIASDYPKYHDVNWVFGFLQYESVLRLTSRHSVIFVFEASCKNATVLHAFSKFTEESIASWGCFPHRQCPNNSSLIHSRQNLKQSTCAK